MSSSGMFNLHNFEMNTVWDPTSTSVLFPLIYYKLHACSKAAWRAAKSTWVEEQMRQYVSPLPLIRRAGLGILAGSFITFLSYKFYRSWRKNKDLITAERNVRVFADDELLRQWSLPLPENLDEDWFLAKQDEEYYARQGIPSRIYSDFEMPMDLYLQSGISTSRWFCDLLERQFVINVRVIEEPKRVTFFFEGPPRNISRAREYLRRITSSLFEHSAIPIIEYPSTPASSRPPSAVSTGMSLKSDTVDHHEGDVSRH
ncbi:uncharacterized protein LOC129586792 [Paramacrobiotus metropolitanus]|uniref:uncharacterized protein LOC129586792 n=1 Tax=Paramacrobiotus metropolitanus TaxID=2943436 RepID=UPI002445C4D7|nr:uncharacterized protein LOC129586792 [Paramacrobiotus metropolitanus]XP_055336194.1 uncharacterized protein LOC129586792 [Paramacrobiotus metropolitanus]